jgi:hypothetical protein
VDAVQSFRRSGDLAALGTARVVRVRARPEGGSHVLAFWTEGEFRPFELLAPREVELASVSTVAPPAGTVQDLSLSAPGHPYGLNAYRVPLPLDQALEHYERGLQSVGFTALDPAAAGLDWREPGRDARALSRGRTTVYVTGLTADGGTRVLVMQSSASDSDAATDSATRDPKVARLGREE